ncbi:SRPBCC family protein [Embleya sp. NPDC020630]|uniref:SRPBCC family protein n=1 Tax=Embleya sp. NPDC020630 TaxID=3363979 RepID=UPI0037AC062B
MPHFETTTHIRVTPARAFEACLDIDAHTASMASSGERAIGGVTAGRIGLGESVTWRARHFGVVWRMTARITAYEEPSRFVDEQVGGPFAHWRHEHRFTSDGAGGTVMRDVVDYAAPFGPIGAVVGWIGLHRYMVRLIVARNEYLKDSLESAVSE